MNKRQENDARHYLASDEANILRDRLIDFIEECLVIQVVLHQNRKSIPPKIYNSKEADYEAGGY